MERCRGALAPLAEFSTHEPVHLPPVARTTRPSWSPSRLNNASRPLGERSRLCAGLSGACHAPLEFVVHQPARTGPVAGLQVMRIRRYRRLLIYLGSGEQ